MIQFLKTRLQKVNDATIQIRQKKYPDAKYKLVINREIPHLKTVPI